MLEPGTSHTYAHAKARREASSTSRRAVFVSWQVAYLNLKLATGLMLPSLNDTYSVRHLFL
jgi:hypothetical protein